MFLPNVKTVKTSKSNIWVENTIKSDLPGTYTHIKILFF